MRISLQSPPLPSASSTARVAPLVDFHWDVAVGGYQWIDTAAGRVLRAVDALEPDWNYSSDHYWREYRPLQERSGLFWEFAQLDPTEAAIKQFADSFGLLGAGQLSGPASGPLESEPLALWKREIEALREAVIVWRFIAAGNKKSLSLLKAKLAPGNAPLAMQRLLHMDDRDPAMFLLSAIQRTSDQRLRDHVLSRVLFAGNHPRLHVVLQPQTLLAALWLQFAIALGANKSFTKCPQCGIPFEVSRDPSGKRRSARFCSTRCRVAHYRGRIERARQMNKEGTPVREIARALTTRIATVRNWLENDDRV